METKKEYTQYPPNPQYPPNQAPSQQYPQYPQNPQHPQNPQYPQNVQYPQPQPTYTQYPPQQPAYPQYPPQQPAYPQYPPQQPAYPQYPPQQHPQHPPNQPAYNAPQFGPPVTVQPSSGCLQKNQKNKPQSNSVGISGLIFLSGGMNLAWSLGFGTFIYGITTHMRICWFLGAIIGAFIGSFLVNHVQKKIVVLFSAILVIVGGILFVSLPDNAGAIVAARYLDGIANGLIFPLTLVMAGEEAVKQNRGILASTVEVMSFSLGAYIQIIYTTSWSYSYDGYYYSGFGVTEMHGILSILYGAIALLMGFWLVIESPIFFLVRGEEEKAFDSVRRLQRPFVVTQETYDQFEDHKRYIADNKEMSLVASIIVGIPALLKLCLYRAMVAMSFSTVVVYGIIISNIASTGSFAIWPYIVLGTARWLGVFISASMMDSAGRKKPMLFGILCCAGLAFGVGALFSDYWNIFMTSKMTTAMYLIIIYEFFAGISISASSTYLSEAFPLAIKPYYIAITFILECVIQIIICVSTISWNSMSDYFYGVGSLSIIFFVVALVSLPETKHTSLREAQSKFSKLLSLGVK